MFKANNKKRWRNWKLNLLKTCNYETLDHIINTLNNLGILIVRFKKDTDRIDCKNITHIYYNEKHLKDIKSFINVVEPEVPFWVKEAFPKIQKILTKPESTKIYNILTSQKYLYESNHKAILEDESGHKIASSSDSSFTYFRIIKCLYGLLELIEENRTENIKTFSQRLFSDTKVLTRQDIEKLKTLLGNTIVSSILKSDFSEILLSAKFSWRFGPNIGSSIAFKNYTPIPRDMINDIELFNWSASNLLIVENQELFHNIVKQQLLDQNKWGVLLSNGFLSSGEEILISKASNHPLKNIYIWPDLDPYGYEIAKNIAEKFAVYPELRFFLFGFLQNDLENLPVYKKMLPQDIQKVDQLLKTNIHPQVKETILKMKKSGNKGEQEIMVKSINKDIFEKNVFKSSIPLHLK
ncbi:toprim domain-containing protein [Calidifontibacillus oryziterrae]|uniref:DUF2399 domain-containing protein n=1 Tax=Calidifontibacillus oryziterrae TaxID=1191699 RepID=UPI0003627AF3|nr:DUF2399 domain-containing protein [Calidifontibacillus oryziterrae]